MFFAENETTVRSEPTILFTVEFSHILILQFAAHVDLNLIL